MEKNIKNLAYSEIKQILEGKKKLLKNALNDAKEARDSDTKSSAGDKYETAREMMQAEIAKYTQQLSAISLQKSHLNKIDLKAENNTVCFGSCVTTNMGSYFISIAIGKLTIDGNQIYAISLESPLGKILKGKKVGEEAVMNGRRFSILQIQ